jgi:predicted DNA-binding transcriptional regulator YafY
MRVVSTMYQENLTVEETAVRFSVTVRTIFRIIRRCRDAGMPDLMGQQDLMPFAAD